MNVSDDVVYRAAVLWSGRKDRESFLEDISYFRKNWRCFDGLKSVVDEVILKDSKNWRCFDGLKSIVDEVVLKDSKND